MYPHSHVFSTRFCAGAVPSFLPISMKQLPAMAQDVAYHQPVRCGRFRVHGALHEQHDPHELCWRQHWHVCFQVLGGRAGLSPIHWCVQCCHYQREYEGGGSIAFSDLCVCVCVCVYSKVCVLACAAVHLGLPGAFGHRVSCCAQGNPPDAFAVRLLFQPPFQEVLSRTSECTRVCMCVCMCMCVCVCVCDVAADCRIDVHVTPN